MSMAPVNQGYALPAIIPTISPAAPIVRAAAINANISSYELPVKPRLVVDQQELPCCVSCALGGAMETLNPNWPTLAPLFHYYVTRNDRGGADADGFLFLDSGVATVLAVGICRHDLHPHPYTKAGAATKPTTEAHADALTRALGRRRERPRAERVSGVSRAVWIRDQLRQDRPVVIGLELPMSYPDKFLNPDFEWRDPNGSPRSGSGHCVLAFGYNDARQALHIQDNHGPGRFDRGCWWMGYRVADSIMVQDAYSLIP